MSCRCWPNLTGCFGPTVVARMGRKSSLKMPADACQVGRVGWQCARRGSANSGHSLPPRLLLSLLRFRLTSKSSCCSPFVVEPHGHGRVKAPASECRQRVSVSSVRRRGCCASAGCCAQGKRVSTRSGELVAKQLNGAQIQHSRQLFASPLTSFPGESPVRIGLAARFEKSLSLKARSSTWRRHSEKAGGSSRQRVIP